MRSSNATAPGGPEAGGGSSKRRVKEASCVFASPCSRPRSPRSLSAAVPAVAGAAPRAQPRAHHPRSAASHHCRRGGADLWPAAGARSRQPVIRLYHRINPSPSFTLIGTTHTDSAGRYEFTRAEGIVETNRSWFVRGPQRHPQSAPCTSGSRRWSAWPPARSSGTTRHPITFSGHLTPDHTGDTVSRCRRRRIQATAGGRSPRGRVGAGSNYQIPYAFRVPGAYDVRVLFRGDSRNTAAVSDVVTVIIQQAEVPDFTIQTSDPIVTNGAPFTISGTLYRAGDHEPRAEHDGQPVRPPAARRARSAR